MASLQKKEGLHNVLFQMPIAPSSSPRLSALPLEEVKPTQLLRRSQVDDALAFQTTLKLTKPLTQHRSQNRRCTMNGTTGRGAPQCNGKTKNNKRTNQPETLLFERQKKARQQGTLSLPKNAHSLRENWEVADAGVKGRRPLEALLPTAFCCAHVRVHQLGSFLRRFTAAN